MHLSEKKTCEQNYHKKIAEKVVYVSGKVKGDVFNSASYTQLSPQILEQCLTFVIRQLELLRNHRVDGNKTLFIFRQRFVNSMCARNEKRYDSERKRKEYGK